MNSSKYEKHRFKVAPECPCGKDNKDRKFSPLKSNSKAGNCYSCGKYFHDTKNADITPFIRLEPTFMDNEIMLEALKVCDKATFSKWFLRVGGEQAPSILGRYKVGHYRKWSMDVVFWQIDLHQKVRSGKIMAYNSNGKRKKRGYSISWMHTELKLEGFVLEQCLFGEHLLPNFNGKYVGIVESEKTALVATAFAPKTLWLATGGKGNLKFRPELLKALKAYKVILFPDVGAYDEWLSIGAKYGFETDQNLEQLYQKGELAEGSDLADYFLR